MATRYTSNGPGRLDLEDGSRRLPPGGQPGADRVDGRELRRLIADLSRDASQLAHDELTLAKLEIRDVAEAFSSDIKAASRMLVKDMAKVGVALALASLAGLALTAGAILAIGQLLGGAFWAGGLIVGVVLALAAGGLAMSAASDLQDSDELRLEGGRETLDRNRTVLKEEAKESAEFAKDEAQDFKRTMTSDRPQHSRPRQA
jgi:hypothetical protein